jgi:excisionase family DNA binding protein
MSDDRKLFDVQAAAEYLRSIGASSVTINFVRGLISSGQVPHIRIGKKFYLSRQQLDLWLEKHERRAR